MTNEKTCSPLFGSDDEDELVERALAKLREDSPAESFVDVRDVRGARGREVARVALARAEVAPAYTAARSIDLHLEIASDGSVRASVGGDELVRARSASEALHKIALLVSGLPRPRQLQRMSTCAVRRQIAAERSARRRTRPKAKAA